MFIHELKAPAGSRKRRKIVGRGRGSGHGKTSGKGHKGQLSRAGRAVLGGSEGGQVPLIRRLPKYGFRSKNPLINQIVNVESFNKFSNGALVNAQSLRSAGLISSLNKSFKILGKGQISKSVTVEEGSVSASAQEKILKAGGKVDIKQKDVPVVKGKVKK